MKRMKTALALGLALIPTLIATGVSAKIVCRGSYQLVNGSWLATPYCEDNYLANVAHGYGDYASAHEIRNNPSTKEEVCRLVGNDIRVNDICTQFMDTARRGSGN